LAFLLLLDFQHLCHQISIPASFIIGCPRGGGRRGGGGGGGPTRARALRRRSEVTPVE